MTDRPYDENDLQSSQLSHSLITLVGTRKKEKTDKEFISQTANYE